MSSPGKNNKALFIRLAVLIVLGIATLVAVKPYAPTTITHSEVQDMLNSHELVGLSLAEAASKLQHTAPPTQDGLVVFDFAHIRGWKGGVVALDVRGGRVVSAAWNAGPETTD